MHFLDTMNHGPKLVALLDDYQQGLWGVNSETDQDLAGFLS